MTNGFGTIRPPKEWHSVVAKTSYSSKHTQIEKNFTQANWEEKKSQNPNMFDGRKAIFYSREGMDPAKLKVLPSYYSDYLAYQGSSHNGLKMRPHLPAGVIIVAKTNDDKIIVGSRDKTRDKDNPNEFKAQFPCGFMDVDDNFFQQIKQDNNFLMSQVKQNAVREFKEEILDVDDSKIANVEYIGSTYKKQEWPSKKTGTKNLYNINSFVMLVDIDMSYEELLNDRNERPPVDLNEITSIAAIKLKDIPTLKYKPVVTLEGKLREFNAEHPEVFEVISQYMQELKTSQYINTKASGSRVF